jgi:hypothetical protein
MNPLDPFRPRPAIEDLRVPQQLRRSWAPDDLDYRQAFRRYVTGASAGARNRVIRLRASAARAGRAAAAGSLNDDDR